PEAQVDRFMLKLKIGYPSRADERQILETMAKTSGQPTCGAVVSSEQILKAREVINDIYVDDKVKDYIVDLVCATRDPRAHARGQGLCVPERPRLRDAAGREKHRHGRAAPPRGHHLRSRGRGK